MAFGLEVMDGAGRTVLEISDRIPRLWLSTVVNVNIAGATSGFVAVSGMVRDGTWQVVAGVPSSGLCEAVNVYCVSGGFNWNAQFASSTSFSFVATVFKL